MADDASDTLEVAEKKTNGGEEVIPQKVEEPALEGSAESSCDKAFEEVEDVPTEVLAAETVVVAVPEANEPIPKEGIEDKAVVEEAVKEEKPTESEAKDESETGSYKAARTEAEVTDPVKPEKKQSRNVISRMKRSLSKMKKAFACKLPGSKTADSEVKAEEKDK